MRITIPEYWQLAIWQLQVVQADSTADSDHDESD